MLQKNENNRQGILLVTSSCQRVCVALGLQQLIIFSCVSLLPFSHLRPCLFQAILIPKMLITPSTWATQTPMLVERSGKTDLVQLNMSFNNHFLRQICPF